MEHSEIVVVDGMDATGELLYRHNNSNYNVAIVVL